MDVKKIESSGCTAPAEYRLAASLAHEINNPLASLLNLLYLMQHESLSEKGSGYLKLAEGEVQRISQIARSALASLHDRETQEETDLSALVGSVVGFYGSKLHAQGIAVHTRYGPHRNLPVFAGPLRQAFSNLLLNAAAAMPKGGNLHVRVSGAREWSRSNGRQRCGLRVTFADSGCGIEKANMSRILQPFFTTKGAGGCGLGLSLVQDVVQEHGGSLRVRSSTAPGRSGSVFAMFLPGNLC